ncbi:homocysteine S-methyltransferase family protein, partial [bacterium]|nr:homocysteine S-methyltransferase family protein [bacterium]
MDPQRRAASRPSLDERLARGAMLLDGAMGSLLIERGMPLGTNSSLWCTEFPDVVREIHGAYVALGCDIVLTNTFRANRIALGTDSRRVEATNEAAVRLVREAILEAAPEREPLIGGNLGPTGGGARSTRAAEDRAAAAYAEQAEVLTAHGADLLALETMGSLDHVRLAMRGIRSCSALPVMVSFTVRRTAAGFVTLSGDPLCDVAAPLADAGACAVGINCVESAMVREALGDLLDASPLPVFAKPNAGHPVLREGRTMYEQDPVDFARDVAWMVE